MLVLIWKVASLLASAVRLLVRMHVRVLVRVCVRFCVRVRVRVRVRLAGCTSYFLLLMSYCLFATPSWLQARPTPTSTPPWSMYPSWAPPTHGLAFPPPLLSSSPRSLVPGSSPAVGRSTRGRTYHSYVLYLLTILTYYSYSIHLLTILTYYTTYLPRTGAHAGGRLARRVRHRQLWRHHNE